MRAANLPQAHKTACGRLGSWNTKVTKARKPRQVRGLLLLVHAANAAERITMILEQQIWKAKARHREDVAALGKAEGERMGIPYRIYTPITHPSTIVIFEFQFDDLAEHARFWARWRTEPEAQEFLKRLGELVEREHHNELYKVLYGVRPDRS